MIRGRSLLILPPLHLEPSVILWLEDDLYWFYLPLHQEPSVILWLEDDLYWFYLPSTKNRQ